MTRFNATQNTTNTFSYTPLIHKTSYIYTLKYTCKYLSFIFMCALETYWLYISDYIQVKLVGCHLVCWCSGNVIRFIILRSWVRTLVWSKLVSFCQVFEYGWKRSINAENIFILTDTNRFILTLCFFWQNWNEKTR